MGFEEDLIKFVDSFGNKADRGKVDDETLGSIQRKLDLEPDFKFDFSTPLEFDKGVEIGACLLHHIAMSNLPKTLAFLMKRASKEELNLKTKEDASVVHYAAERGTPEVVRVVFGDDRAKVNERLNGFLPLVRAMWDGKKEIVEAIIESCWIPNTKPRKSRLSHLPGHIVGEFVFNMKKYHEHENPHWTHKNPGLIEEIAKIAGDFSWENKPK